ncbi:MAG: hypothetical protein ACREX3_04165 [Gammaproteobacteria bacterium]
MSRPRTPREDLHRLDCIGENEQQFIDLMVSLVIEIQDLADRIDRLEARKRMTSTSSACEQ